MFHRLTAAWLILLLLAACGRSNEPAQESIPLPTTIPSATPEYNSAQYAERVAVNFLDAWQNNDFETMYDLLSFTSQQATSYESFRSAYEIAHAEMRLESLDYQLVAEARESNRVIIYNYDATFTTKVVGTFTDAGRILHLVLDDEAQDWRVAWSSGDIFAEMGSGGRLRLEPLVPQRANIYDRNGAILADMNGRVVSVNVIRSEIPELQTCISTLSEALGDPVETVQDRLANAGEDWLAEVGLMDGNRFLQWEASLERDCDARFGSQAVRRYIYGELLSHIIGYVGYPDEEEIPQIQEEGFRQDSILGRTGIEAFWDETLRGTPGGRLSVVNPSGERLRLLAERNAQISQSVYLTVDLALQQAVFDIISRAYASNTNGWAKTSDGAAALVMDVQTGAILAMVSYPTFDANAFTAFPIMGEDAAQSIVRSAQEDPRRPLVNRVAQGGYPLGSVMKTVTAIAALDSGVYSPDDRYTSTGVWSRDIPRYDWQTGGHGTLTLSGAITVSCNTCFYEAGYRLNETDPSLLPDYANRMGLGRDTGIRDLAASSGFIGRPETKSEVDPLGGPWTYSDAVNMAIGQGFLEVSPLQIARVYAAVANGGTLYRPQLVDRVGLLDEFSYQMEPDPEDTGIAPSVLETVRTGLCRVTTATGGTATHIFRDSPLQDIGVCGKTGTATAGVGDQPSHAWFLAYAPRENPQIVVAVMVENSGEGSAVSAPIAREIMEYYFFDE